MATAQQLNHGLASVRADLAGRVQIPIAWVFRLSSAPYQPFRDKAVIYQIIKCNKARCCLPDCKACPSSVDSMPQNGSLKCAYGKHSGGDHWKGDCTAMHLKFAFDVAFIALGS